LKEGIFLIKLIIIISIGKTIIIQYNKIKFLSIMYVLFNCIELSSSLIDEAKENKKFDIKLIRIKQNLVKKL
tara:strand:+ start:170 stop:385 length:216 start_codon:yes stop_codon:yes gene_type:complete